MCYLQLISLCESLVRPGMWHLSDVSVYSGTDTSKRNFVVGAEYHVVIGAPGRRRRGAQLRCSWSNTLTGKAHPTAHASKR